MDILSFVYELKGTFQEAPPRLCRTLRIVVLKNEPDPDPGFQMDEGHFAMCAWILKEKLQEDPDRDVAQKKNLDPKQGPGLVGSGTVNFVTINRSGDD